MKLYRLQLGTGASWAIEWFATQAEASRKFREAVEANAGRDAYLDQVEVPVGKTDDGSGRDNVAEALNNATVNRDLWPGKRVQYYNAKHEEEEDLLS